MKKKISLIVLIFIVLFSISCSNVDSNLSFEMTVQGKSVYIGNNLYGTFSDNASSFTTADSGITATLTKSEDISYTYSGPNLEIQFKIVGQQNLDIIQIKDGVELTAFGSLQ